MRAIGFVLFLALFPLPASSQMVIRPCYDLQHWLTFLETEHGEYPMAKAAIGETKSFTLFISPTSKEWSLIFKDPNGCNSMVASGDKWEWMKPPTIGEDS